MLSYISISMQTSDQFDINYENQLGMNNFHH